MPRFQVDTASGSVRVVGRIRKALDQGMTKYLEQEAARLQEAQQSVLRERVEENGRPQRASRSLEAAIVSPQNRRVTSSGFVVGGYLSESPAAPYYRGVDKGSNKFVGRTILGAFLQDGKITRPMAGSKAALKLVQFRQQEGNTDSFSGQALRNTGGQFRALELKPGEVAKSGQRGAFRILIKHGIPAYNYTTIGFHNWRNSGAVERLTENIRHLVRMSNGA